MPPLDAPALAARFREAFAAIDPARSLPVADLYDPDVVFVDPFHRIEGRDALGAYFDRLGRNVRTCTFAFHDTLCGERSVALRWTMRLELRRGLRAPIVVDGTTWLTLGTLAATHTDHFDAGALLYEHVPLLGGAVRVAKRAMAGPGVTGRR